MLPFLIIGAFCLVIAIVALVKGPSKENDTVNEINERLKREEQQRENEQKAKKLAKEHKRLQLQETAATRRQEAIDMMRRRQDEIREQKSKEQVDRIIQTNDKRNKEEEERVAREKQEEEEKAAREKKEEKRKFAAKMEQLKIEEERLKEEAKQLADRERVAKEKFGDLRWPTREEFQQTLYDTKYDENNFHFAIVGRAGSGKSSLINAFRNLKNKSPGAAPTGTKETTLHIKRYEDPGDQPPRQWMIWFDIPGAGTLRIPSYDYFIKQGLYIFDLIILAIGDRFEEIDARILENCVRFKVPVFIVRSKADMHILNSMKEEEEYDSNSEDSKLYERCRDAFISGTREMVSQELERCGLQDQPVYVVSRDELRQTYHNSLQPPSIQQALWRQRKGNVIHEDYLVKALLTAAAQRRCEEQTPLDQLMDGCSALQDAAQEFMGHQRRNLSSLFARRPKKHAPQATARAEVDSDTQSQPTYQRNRGIRKVIKSRKPTDAGELYCEISKNDPELPNMLIGQPAMFGSHVAMLTFYHLAPIPESIYAFGSWLRVEEYKDMRMEKARRERRGSHAQADETEQIDDEGHRTNWASGRDGAYIPRGRRGGKGGRGRDRERERGKGKVVDAEGLW